MMKRVTSALFIVVLMVAWIILPSLEQQVPGELSYAIDAELGGIGLVRYGTEFMPGGKVMLRYLKQQQYLENHLFI